MIMRALLLSVFVWAGMAATAIRTHPNINVVGVVVGVGWPCTAAALQNKCCAGHAHKYNTTH